MKSKFKVDLFGFHACREAWHNADRQVHGLYVTEQAWQNHQQTFQTALTRPKPTIITKQEIDHSLPPGSVHQGIALSCNPLEEVDITDLIIQASQRPSSLIVMLDQVTDPHNVGAILRSACAFGSLGLILQRKHAPDLNGILAKTACGAVEHLPVAYETNLTRSLEKLQQEGFFAIGLDERGEQFIGDLPQYEKAVLVLGAEGPGIRRLVKEQCDLLTKLPTQEPIAALNVSNAAAVALYAMK